VSNYGQQAVWLGEENTTMENMNDYLAILIFYLPLGVIGAWRWGAWLFRRLMTLFYRPTSNPYSAPVSVVTPVYNENPEVFHQALESWQANNPREIIAVIDYTDTRCIQEFREFTKQYPAAKLIITETPGKRPAIAEGIKAAEGEILALVDSDTIWDKSLLNKALSPFSDPEVGGVTTRQNVLEPKTIAQRIFDINLDQRNLDELPFVAAKSDALTCLSGRTALYRSEAILPFVDDMLNETFWGKPCIGGDDKRFTYLIESAGWKARYQSSAQVYTSGATKLSTLFKQRTRWARNSWRADLRALWQGWVWKHPILAFHLIDRMICPFTLSLSLTYLLTSIFFKMWLPVAILLVWYLFSRGIKIIPHLKRHPADIALLPVYVFANFAIAIIRIYGLLTLNRQDWITRRDTHRAPKTGVPHLILARIGTFAVIIILAVIVVHFRSALTF